MSGKVLVRVPPPQRAARKDGRLGAPWFRRAAGQKAEGTRPAILSFQGSTFVEDLLSGLGKTGGSWTSAPWPQLKAYRDWAEPPRGVLDGRGKPILPSSLEREAPLPGELEGGLSLEATLSEEDNADTWLRKLYLPQHQRFNLVCCELICAAKGEPRIDPARVAEVGFVVRRLLPDSSRERWEDWLPSADERSGVWVELSDLDGSLNAPDGSGGKSPVDPSALPAGLNITGDLKALGTRARLGLTDPKAPLKLALEPLKPLPPTVGEAGKHTAHFGYLPLLTRHNERPDPPAQDLTQARVALRDQAVAAATALISAQFPGDGSGLGAELRAGWSLLAGLVWDWNYDAFDSGCESLLDGLDGTFLSMWGGAALWSQRPDLPLISRQQLLDLPTINPIPGAMVRIRNLEILVLLQLRRARVELIRLFQDKLGVDEADKTTQNSGPRAVGVGAAGVDLEALLLADAARNKRPQPWSSPGISMGDIRVKIHRAGLALERQLADLHAALGEWGDGGAYALSQWVAQELDEIGGSNPDPGEQMRLWGLDPSSQPVMGLMILPGLRSPRLNLESLREKVRDYYDPSTGTAAPVVSRVQAEMRARAELVRPRYDANSVYAVWCFARLKAEDPCERDQLVWSARSEPFGIAPTDDLLGLQPVSLALPDIPRLIRDIPRIPKAGALPFAAVHTPANSGILTGEEPADTAREWGIAWICSFGIPLFTICAWIAFSIILAILLLIPGFIWLLLLKICIPVPVPKKG